MSLAGAAAGGAGGDDQHPRRILWKKPAGQGPAKQVRKKAIGKGGPENSSCPYKGARQRTWGKWVSEIRDPNHRSKRLWLGSFDTAREAAIAYDNAAWRLYGETDRLNFPELIQPPAPSAEPREVAGGGATSEAVAEEEEIWSGLGDLPDMEIYKYPW